MSNSAEVTPNPRFVVSMVGYDNPIPVMDEAPRPSRRESRRLSVSEFFAALIPGSGPRNAGSRANSIFSEFFKDTDRTVMDYTQEAAPRLESYRNSLTMHSYVVRPTLDELHEAQKETHISLVIGKGRNTGAIKFGWIKGVYIRCLLNIWGIMLFLRMGWMTGQCGIVLAVIIILLSTLVTVITTLSMSAICTNGDVRGGGAYYVISRSLGPEFGGVVGVILFLANAVSAALYITGAGEAVKDILNEYHQGIAEHPSGVNDIRIASVITLVLMMSVTGIGMAFENKTQMVLLVVLLVAMMDYFVGALLPPTVDEKAKGFVGWSLSTASVNAGADYRKSSFFGVFAVFFPSVTGMLAGANISGDLKDPCSAIPKGTLWAIATTSLSYTLIVIWLGFTFVRDATGNVEDYINGTFQNCQNMTCRYGLMNDYQVVKLASGSQAIIYAGIFAATLSSALVSIVSAPRILQALCVDGIIPWLKWFGKGYGADNDPRRALVLTFVIALGFTLIGDINEISGYISNFFMAAMGLINFSCFHASYVKSPGFRPGFRYYNLWLSLLGSLLCAVIMFVMDWITALVTDVVIVALYVYISKTCPEINWGSSLQGFAYRNALYYLNKLNRIEEHVKNYRPAILALTGNASSRPELVDFAGHLTKDHGLLICARIEKQEQTWKRKKLISDLNNKWLDERCIKGFFTYVEAPTFQEGVSYLCQVSGIGRMKPNILLMGYKQNWESCKAQELLDYFDTIHEILDAHLSLCILRVVGGMDFSRYFDTIDDLPIVSNENRRTSRKKRKNKAVQMPVPPIESMKSLETVIEEPSTQSSMESFKNPQLPAVFIDNKSIENALASVGKNAQSSSHVFKENILPSQSDEGIPEDVFEAANTFQRKQNPGNIDVWWLYDTGGLTLLLPYILTTRSKFKDCKLRVFSVAQEDKVLTEEQLNLAALLHKFRIPFTDLTVLSSVGEPLHEYSAQRFEKMMTKWIFSEQGENSSVSISRDDLNAHRRKTNQYLRLRELMEKYSKDANMVVTTLPLPKKGRCPAPIYMAWLDILTHDMPPTLLVRGNQSTVLTFYS